MGAEGFSFAPFLLDWRMEGFWVAEENIAR
jgi:hypothetical protein